MADLTHKSISFFIPSNQIMIRIVFSRSAVFLMILYDLERIFEAMATWPKQRQKMANMAAASPKAGRQTRQECSRKVHHANIDQLIAARAQRDPSLGKFVCRLGPIIRH